MSHQGDPHDCHEAPVLPPAGHQVITTETTSNTNAYNVKQQWGGGGIIPCSFGVKSLLSSESWISWVSLSLNLMRRNYKGYIDKISELLIRVKVISIVY